VLVQVYSEDKPEKFQKDERTIDWIGSLMDSYAAAWHIQRLKGTLAGVHLKSMTGYVNALKLRFENRDAKDEPYADSEKVRYEGCIRDMFTQIQTYNNRAMVTGAALKKLILQWLPQKIIEQMHTVDPMGKTDLEIITIITNAERTAEKWEAARKNLGLKATLKSYNKKFPKPEKFDRKSRRRDKLDKPRTDRNQRKFKKNSSEWKSKRDHSKTEGVESSEIQRHKAAGQCLRCAWPADRKGAHRVKNCVRLIKLDKGTAGYPKAKEYQKMKVAGLELNSDEEDNSGSTCSHSNGSDSGDSKEELEEDSEGEYLDESGNEELQKEQKGRNWRDFPPDSELDCQATLSLKVENQCFNTPFLIGRPFFFHCFIFPLRMVGRPKLLVSKEIHYRI